MTELNPLEAMNLDGMVVVPNCPEPVADVHFVDYGDKLAAVQEANCPEPEPKPDLAQRVMALREAHDLAAAKLCEALDALQDSILGDALNLTGSQQAYQEGRTAGRSEMARECINAIDERLQALKPGTLAHQALGAHRRDMMRHVLPL